jgi:hypothetical protein
MESVSNLTATIQVDGVALRVAETKLMKAIRVWTVEEGLVRRVLLCGAIGCTASEKEH